MLAKWWVPFPRCNTQTRTCHSGTRLSNVCAGDMRDLRSQPCLNSHPRFSLSFLSSHTRAFHLLSHFLALTSWLDPLHRLCDASLDPTSGSRPCSSFCQACFASVFHGAREHRELRTYYTYIQWSIVLSRDLVASHGVWPGEASTYMSLYTNTLNTSARCPPFIRNVHQHS